MDRTASLRANAGQFATTWGNDLSAAPENSRPRLSPQLGWTGRRIGAGDGNRTHVSSLGSCSSTIELHPRSGLILREFAHPPQIGTPEPTSPRNRTARRTGNPV